MNKRERHKMYKAALERLDRMGTNCGLCCCVSRSHPAWLSCADVQDLPEIKAQRPKGLLDALYWWPLNEEGYQKRRQVLLKCIKETMRKPHVRAKKRA